MRHPMLWSEPERSFVRRYFDGVDKVVSGEMCAGARRHETTLTADLARLLDGVSAFQKMLDYPLASLNSDLAECGTGTQMAVEFETNEHTAAFESAVSHADLGIVVRCEETPFRPAFEKGLIVQAKKLYESRDSFRLSSRYGEFQVEQFKRLREIAKKSAWDGVCYFLYNPLLEEFDEDDREAIRATESQLFGPWSASELSFRRMHVKELFHMIDHGDWPYWARGYAEPQAGGSPEEIRSRRQQYVASRPGVRVLGMTSIEQILGDLDGLTGNKTFALHECYQYAFSDHWWHCSGVPFVPLSVFVVDFLLGCIRGSSDAKIVRIAEGREPKPDDGADDSPSGVAVRHTLRITVHNTLAQTDMRFHRHD